MALQRRAAIDVDGAPTWGELFRRARLVARANVSAWLARRAAPALRSAFAGASTSRLNADWILSPIQSADQEIRGDHRALVGRAREMVRNHPYAARFVELVADNVIGPDGIRLQARVKRADDEFDVDTNRRIEAAWERWGEPETASADGRLSWVDIQALSLRSLPQDGEILLRMLPGFPNAFGFAVQVLDPDLLDTELNQAAGAGSNEIRMGIEIDGWGRAVAYWLWTEHPAEYGRIGRRERVRVPADQIIHEFLVRRPGQTRGVTWFAPVMVDARMLSGYQEAELVAARTAASKMGFFQLDPEFAAAPDPRRPAGQQGGLPTVMEADPGRFDILPPGYSLESWDPQHPNSSFGLFVKSILRSISAGLGVSYTGLTGDLEAVNYSSIRAGLLSERDTWRRLQSWAACHIHRRVYREWMKWALTTGALKLQTMDAERYSAHAWLPRGWAWVDPEKDIDAALKAIAGGLDSRTRVAAEHGRDFEEILAELDRENQLAVEYGVELTTDVGSPTETGDSNGEGTDGAAGDAPGRGDRAEPRLRLARRLG